jgi:hypothetical protein
MHSEYKKKIITDFSKGLAPFLFILFMLVFFGAFVTGYHIGSQDGSLNILQSIAVGFLLLMLISLSLFFTVCFIAASIAVVRWTIWYIKTGELTYRGLKQNGEERTRPNRRASKNF